MSDRFSINALAQSVNKYCLLHGVLPLHKRVGLSVTIRNIRYYQSLGLVDPPLRAKGKGFTDKHRSQLIGIRLLQAKGLPLDRIHAVLAGRSEEQLREIEQKGPNELEFSAPVAAGSTAHFWTLNALGDDALLLTRRNLTSAQRQRLLEVLHPGAAPAIVSRPHDLAEEETGLESFRPETD